MDNSNIKTPAERQGMPTEGEPQNLLAAVDLENLTKDQKLAILRFICYQDIKVAEHRVEMAKASSHNPQVTMDDFGDLTYTAYEIPNINDPEADNLPLLECDCKELNQDHDTMVFESYDGYMSPVLMCFKGELRNALPPNYYS